ncbi:MAG: 50S ribosomal protein L29 [Opitutales bacterium]|jgi:large subunit ribosomal protein L29|nr:50S ribosomal protein L29 [Opitutales bacterium]MDG2253632.1 50S ribosomal protein L29 [Opitutaceae bacterium]MBT5166864.1 50S ribosomal protein L29 [Opitutales bacterium]MBT5814367.1 50S ribosomal protein L29 [Opitutales bacterium]MBT6381540.1 50S ribosomal protein L29 [Opitutales bacterium]
MKVKEIRELSLAEIEKTIRDTRDQLLQLKLRKQTGQVENTAELTQRRKDIAKMETIRSEKLLTEAKSA